MGKRRGVINQKQGKNKKKSWKQIQHNDVEKFMDEIREDERLGGIRSKPNEKLFVIDDFSFSVQQDLKSDIKNQTPSKSDKNDSGPLVRLDDLKCFHLLKPHTQVPDPIVKRNPIRRRGQRKSEIMHLKDEKRRSKKTISITEPEEKCKDPWAMEEPKTILDSEWIDSSIKRQNLRPRATKPDEYVTSELPAVETPHPGFSYNPSFRDHQALLKQAVDSATLITRKERNLINATARTKCLTVEKFESESDTEDLEMLVEDVKPIVIPKSKAKTKQQKRKEKEEKEKARLLQMKKQDNIRLNEVFRIKSIKKQIKDTEQKQKERLAKLVKKTIERKKFGQKEISKFKYEELSLDPALSDEIQGSLVGVQSHNRLVLERFKSLQKRNILEPRVKQRMQRKLRVKKFQKSIDKMDWEKTGYWNGIKVLK